MKITKDYLKQVIKEELEKIKEVSIDPLTFDPSGEHAGRGPAGSVIDATPELKVKRIRKKAGEIFNKYMQTKNISKEEEKLLGWSSMYSDSELLGKLGEVDKMLSSI